MAKPDHHENSNPSLYDGPLFSDVKIKFGGQIFNGHKAILCKESKHFHKALTGGFEEAQSGIIDLSTDEDPHAVRAMLRHIYGLEYIAIEERSDIALQAAIFDLADKYDVVTLRQRIVKKLPERFMDKVDVRDKGFMNALVHAFLVVPADNSMQQLLLVRAKKSIANLMREKEFLNALGLVPELCLALLKHSYENVQEVQPIYECTKYRKSFLYLQDP
ncbi:hypothetical protein BDV97DRAFT_401738 [Delphinella strobiligena]|nr:hypothetical protein BDV97DRAFT_401738 [Delphinella strobiligena]